MASEREAPALLAPNFPREPAAGRGVGKEFYQSGEDATAWIRDMREALRVFPERDLHELPADPKKQVAAFNRMLDQGLAICEVQERYGLHPTMAEYRSGVISVWQKCLRRRLPKGELLCIAAAAFYKAEFRLNEAGPRDSRMEAALVGAEITIRATRDLSTEMNAIEFEQAFQREKVRLLNARNDRHGPDGQSAAYEAARKAIARFKKSVRSEVLFWLNPETFRVEIIQQEDRLHGATDKPGRPRSR